MTDKKSEGVEFFRKRMEDLFKEVEESGCLTPNNPRDWKTVDLFIKSMVDTSYRDAQSIFTDLFEFTCLLRDKVNKEDVEVVDHFFSVIREKVLTHQLLIAMTKAHFQLVEKEDLRSSSNADLHYDRLRGMVEEGLIRPLEVYSKKMEAESMTLMSLAEAVINSPLVSESVKKELSEKVKEFRDALDEATKPRASNRKTH